MRLADDELGLPPLDWNARDAARWKPKREGRELDPLDQLPHLTRSAGITYAMGYCGSGVAMGSWMGTLAGEWIARGAQPAFAGLRFPRLPFYRGHPWFLPIVGMYYSLLDRR